MESDVTEKVNEKNKKIIFLKNVRGRENCFQLVSTLFPFGGGENERRFMAVIHESELWNGRRVIFFLSVMPKK